MWEPTQFHDLFRQIRSDNHITVCCETYTSRHEWTAITLFRSHIPQALVHTGMNWQAVLVGVDIVRIHPSTTDAVGLFERDAFELRIVGGEILQSR